LSGTALALIPSGKTHAHTSDPGAFVFSTRRVIRSAPEQRAATGRFPRVQVAGLPRATWLTFRRTYASWAHDKGVSGKVVAQLMGHANVDTTLNVYTQVLDGSVRSAMETVGDELFTIVQQNGGANADQQPLSC